MRKEPDVWKRTASKKIADCRVFQVREDESERTSDKARGTFYVLENPDWVNVVAVTEANEVVLIEQYRHGAEEIVLEIPGGMVDDGEDAETAARRELLEETGYTSDRFVYLGKSQPNPAIQNNWIHHYLASNCKRTAQTKFDEHENIVVKLVSLNSISQLIKEEKITHSLVFAAFYKMNQL